MRVLDLIAVLMLAANVLILALRGSDWLRGEAGGSYLLERTASELFFCAVIVIYLVVRYRPRSN